MSKVINKPRIRDYVSLVVCCIIFVMSVILFFPVRIFGLRAGFFMMYLWSALTNRALRLFSGLTYTMHGMENIPDGPCVFACNHQALWETVCLHEIFYYKKTAFVTKPELSTYGPVYWLIKSLGFITLPKPDSNAIGQGRRAMVSKMRKLIDNNQSIFLFPEGRRNPFGKPTIIKAGIIDWHRENPDVKIVPITMNAGRYWEVLAPICHTGGNIDVQIHKPIDNSENIGEELIGIFKACK